MAILHPEARMRQQIGGASEPRPSDAGYRSDLANGQDGFTTKGRLTDFESRTESDARRGQVDRPNVVPLDGSLRSIRDPSRHPAGDFTPRRRDRSDASRRRPAPPGSRSSRGPDLRPTALVEQVRVPVSTAGLRHRVLYPVLGIDA